MSKVPVSTDVNADIRHVCGHVQPLNAEEIKEYNKSPEKFALDKRAPDADGNPSQVLHCLGCNQLSALSGFTFVATGENLDPAYVDPDEEEVEVEEEDPVTRTRVKKTVKRKKSK